MNARARPGCPRSPGPGTRAGTRPAARGLGHEAGPGLAQSTGELHELDTPGQRLRRPPHDVRRRAPEHQEPRGAPRPIGQGPEDGEQFRQGLDFVQDHEPPLGRGRARDSAAAQVGLDSSSKKEALRSLRQRAGQRRLAALAGPEQGRDRRPPYGRREASRGARAVRSRADAITKVRSLLPKFQELRLAGTSWRGIGQLWDMAVALRSAAFSAEVLDQEQIVVHLPGAGRRSGLPVGPRSPRPSGPQNGDQHESHIYSIRAGALSR